MITVKLILCPLYNSFQLKNSAGDIEIKPHCSLFSDSEQLDNNK